jgi:hypothetical protein
MEQSRNKRRIMKYINIDFIIPNKDCKICDYINDYICFDCESIQVKEKYPNAKWELPDWIIEQKGNNE